ncbi:MAG: VWA domain-containing protein, partial [Gemmatimonadota bacterium]
ALMAIRPGGATNLSGGWLQGRALLQERFEAEGVNRVILLTDGLANQGITDAETLTRLTAQAHRDGVGTTTVGVGEHFDEELLAAMADAGGGSSYYIERPDQAGGIFEEEVEGLLSIAAQNLTVSVRPRTGASVATVHHQYPSQVGADDALILSVGDLYAREPREVLADFLVPGGSAASTESGGEDMAEGADGGSPVADFVIEADCWTGDETMERRRISIPITWSPDAGAVTHPEVARVFTLLEAARARREAVERGDRGDLAGAVQTLRDAAGHLAAHHPSDPLMVAEAQDLHRAAQAMEDEAEFRAMDRKYLRTQASHYARSRRSAGQRTTRG